jgi:hypothetical protein
MSEPMQWGVRDEPLASRPVPVTDMAAAYPSPVGTPNPRARRPRTGLAVVVTVLVMLGLVAAAGGGWWWLHRDTGPTARQQAIAACEDAVRGVLKAPATAQFSGEQAVPSGTDAYDVSGNVDAENSFGALLRQRWTCNALRFAAGWEGTAKLLA